MSAFYSGFRRLFACLIGLVFFLSGMLKIIDPVGTTLIVREYLKFFNLTFLMGLDRPIAIAISLIESLVGAALLAGVWSKIVAVITMAMVAFFTVITVILLVKNPEMDCGCFGEAIHLTHLQSFLKNVALCLFCVLAFLPFKHLQPPRNIRYVGFAIAALVVVAGSVYSNLNLPLIDFTPFASGHEILSPFGNSDPDAPVLSFKDDYGDYYDDYAIYGQVLMVSAYEPEKLTHEDWVSYFHLMNDAYKYGSNLLIVISDENVSAAPIELKPNTFLTDYKTAVSLNRSNGGVTYLEDGAIIAKWPKDKIPRGEALSEVLSQDPAAYLLKTQSRGRITFQAAVVGCLAVLLLL